MSMAQTIESCIEAFLANSTLDGENSLVRSARVCTYALNCGFTRAALSNYSCSHWSSLFLFLFHFHFHSHFHFLCNTHPSTRAVRVLILVRIDVQQVSAAHRLRQVHLHPNVPSHSHSPYALRLLNRAPSVPMPMSMTMPVPEAVLRTSSSSSAYCTSSHLHTNRAHVDLKRFELSASGEATRKLSTKIDFQKNLRVPAAASGVSLRSHILYS